MTGEAGGAITLLTGAITLRLALSGDYKRFVRPGMGPLLAAAGVALVVVGLAVVIGALRHRPEGDARAGGEHDDHEPERVGWLVLVPVLAVLLVAPPALGAFAVDRVSRVEVKTGALFDPLPAGAAPRPMHVAEFVQRAGDRDGASMSGATVELTGFVAATGQGAFDLARYSIACCAGDAVVAVVAVESGGPRPSRDGWVRVTGSFRPGGADPPVLVAARVEPIDVPEDPYE